MMRKQIYKILALAFGVLLLTACATTQPIHNVTTQPIPNGLTDKQIVKAMQIAGSNRHWNISQVKPGLMVGTINVRDHYAKIKIPYTKSSYSILYADSYNLDFNNDKIHRNYNKWINTLNGEIQSQLVIQQINSK